MKTVYVVIWEDRHTDVTVHVFSESTHAIEFAKRKTREMDRFGKLDETLTEPMKQGGWLYYGCYSCEGDNLCVVAAQVDAEKPTA